MSTTFIHTADLHLGSRLNTVGAESQRMQKRLKNATYSAFENIVNACIDEDVDFLVISGDIYDEDSRSVKANQFLAKQMERLEEEGIQAYIIHGNHDPMDEGEEFVDLPENVHVFGSEEPKAIDFNDKVEIIGQSYRSKHERRKMAPSFKPSNSKTSIGLLHTELDPENEDYVPVSLDDLEQKNIDYWALGHIHQTKIYGDNLAAYPGIPQGRHIEEKGIGGCLKVEIDDNDAQIDFLPVSLISWREERIYVEEGEVRNLTDIENKVDEIVGDIEVEFEDLEIEIDMSDFDLEGYILRWILEGHSEVHSQFEDSGAVEVLKNNLRDSLGSRRPFIWTEEIKDRTRPPIPNIEEVKDNDVIEGFRELVEEIEEDNEFQEMLRSEIGEAWKEVEDKEDVKDHQLALTEEKFDELIDRAEEKLEDELLRRTV